MNEMQVFTNPEFGSIRTFQIDAEPWFVNQDVCNVLEIRNPRQALTRLDEDEKGVISNDTPGGEQNMNIINEFGFYVLVLGSRKPEAKRFKRWVTHEVLPAIRRTGAYSVQNATPPTTPQRTLTTDDYIRAASIISTCRNERLPYVLNLLSQGGIDIPLVAKIASNRDESGECAKLINRAIDDYGMGTREIGRLTGLAATQIQRIRTGASIPTIERATMIATAIKNAVPEIE